ncbi:MAG TPA: hypothetical protein DDZ69_11575, partial [Porphyromonadaceae bacterium]|nr:hypothetical protein [Porphyromonadaceae bacterium]
KLILFFVNLQITNQSNNKFNSFTMKKFILLFTLSVFGLLTFGQQVERGISIIPEPVSVVKKGGYYVLPDNIVISAP